MRVGGFKDMTGLRFGRLTVVGEAGPGRFRTIRWFVDCDCGNRIEVDGDSLRKGRTRSCGCLQREASSRNMKKVVPPNFVTHGHTIGGPTATYRIWAGMIARCSNPNLKTWKNYGGRGIEVCEQWKGRGGFAVFLADMGERPEGLTLDRIDNEGNYEPGNCKWSTWSEQAYNRRPKSTTKEK